MASITDKLIFRFNLNLKSYTWLVSTMSDNVVLYYKLKTEQGGGGWPLVPSLTVGCPSLGGRMNGA